MTEFPFAATGAGQTSDLVLDPSVSVPSTVFFQEEWFMRRVLCCVVRGVYKYVLLMCFMECCVVCCVCCPVASDVPTKCLPFLVCVLRPSSNRCALYLASWFRPILIACELHCKGSSTWPFQEEDQALFGSAQALRVGRSRVVLFEGAVFATFVCVGGSAWASLEVQVPDMVLGK
jgi:hypothetical protein